MPQTGVPWNSGVNLPVVYVKELGKLSLDEVITRVFMTRTARQVWQIMEMGDQQVTGDVMRLEQVVEGKRTESTQKFALDDTISIAA